MCDHTEVQVFEIPGFNMGILQKRVDKLNQRANKLGCPPIEIVEHGVEYTVDRAYRQQVAEGILRAEDAPHTKIHLVSVKGEGPKLAGWKFLGTLDHNSVPGSVIVKTVPGETIPKEFFHNDALCDHCAKIRRRTETFVVEHEDGTQKQVGRQCIRDFLGHDATQHFRLLSAIRTLMDELGDPDSGFYGGRGPSYYNKEEVLRTTCAVIRTNGWVSRQQARESYDKIATADVVSSAFNPPVDSRARREWEEWKNSLIFKPEEDQRDILGAISWLNEQDPTSEYIHNLQAINNSEVDMPHNMFGIWCSLIAVYQREMEKLRRAAANKFLDEWVGEIKKRQDFTVTLEGINYIDTDYGTTALHNMRDEDGRIIKWFCSGRVEMKVGNKYRIKGTVKKHDEYKNQKQTVLNRVVVLSTLSEENDE